MSVRSFLKEFWKDGKMVGSMIPSSRFLARKMMQSIDFERTKVLVELGPGDGVFTHSLLAKLPKDATLFVFELNDAFYDSLKKKFTDPRIRIIHDSAENIATHLERNGFSQADVVLSSLPLANFSSELKNKILSASHRILKPNGLYVQFQYTLNAKKAIKRFFPSMSLSFTPINFPPAFVYTCKK